MACWGHLQNKPIVEAINLSWLPTPNAEAEAHPLLSGLSFAVGSGERVLLTGPSGSGKSTLLRAIAGVLQQTEAGQFGGELFVRGRCGLVLQDPANSYVAARLGSEIAFGPENLAIVEAEIRLRVQLALADVALEYGVHRPTNELSGGESQRMALAGVLALEPAVLLLDEPLSMLDPVSSNRVVASISQTLEAHPTTAAIIVDHDAQAWQGMVSRVLVLTRDGRLQADMPIGEFLSMQPKTQTQIASQFELGYRANQHRATQQPATQQLATKQPATEAATISALVGPSGAGKTTELRRMLKKLSASDVGWVPQQAEFTVAGNTVWQSATATARNLGQGTDLAMRLLTELGLQDQLDQNPHRLSGGELRRLALVSALAHYPSQLILDEPTVGQDAETWQAVAGIILAARRAGVRVTLATHDEKLIALADEVIQVSLSVPVATVSPRVGRIAPLAALAITFALVAASFAVTSIRIGVIALASEAILTLALWRVLPQQRARRFAPILIALASIWFSNTVFAAGGFGLAGFERATTVTLRVAFFALPSVLLAGALRPAELAGALVKWCRAPARPAAAAAAALVRLEFIQWQWAAVRETRRLRGFRSGRGPWARTREFAASLFALLVQSLRSAGDLAVAMQARGFGEPSAKHRTWVKF